MTVLGLFPGQGAQVVGMGKHYYESNEKAKDIYDLADKVLGYEITRLCFEGPEEELKKTANAQPAILLTSYVDFVVSRIKIDVACGHSLGEYSAMLASNALSFEDALTLVRKRGMYMQECLENVSGGMLAVLKKTETEVEELIKKVLELSPDSSLVLEIANLNTAGQVVISGNKPGVDAFVDFASKDGVKIIALNVAGPFHCSLMSKAAENLATELDKVALRDFSIPVYSNVTAQIIKNSEEARSLLKKQVTSSVRWNDLIVNAIKEQEVNEFVEFSPGTVLTGMMKRINPDVPKKEVLPV